MIGRWLDAWRRRRGTRALAAHDELEREFQAHLDLAADDYRRRGLSDADARRHAAAKFGSRLAARERVDDQRPGSRLDAWWTDAGYAVRALRRTPGFALAAMLVLALGIGVNIAVFTVVNATLFKGFRGIADQDRVVYLSAGRGCCLSLEDLADWRAGTTSFQRMGAVADLRVAFEAGAGAETATATEITAATFGVLRAQPALGRDFVPQDDVPGAPRVAIVSDSLWRARLGADPGVVGRTVRINGLSTTIVGVMPRDFTFPQRQDLWLPLGPRATGRPRNDRGLWFAVARLADGVTFATAQAELDAVGGRLAAAYPATNANVRPVVHTFPDFFVGPSAVAIYGTLWGAVGLVLLVACANLANLLLARAAAGTREAAVRLALGAGRGRVVRQQLFESSLLALGGGALGAWIGHAALRAYASVAVAPTQQWAAQLFDYSVDRRTLAYLAVLSIVSGLLIGLLPALRLARLDVQTSLRDGGRGTVGRSGRRRVTATIVAAQVAIAVVLLSAAGVLARSLLTIRDRDLGFNPSRVLVTLARLPEARYPDQQTQSAFYDRLAENIGRLPGIDAVAFADELSGQNGGRTGYELDGTSAVESADRPQARVRRVSSNYFAAMGTALEAGRDFDARDGTPERRVAIVDRRFAALHWPPGDAIGRRLRVYNGTSAGPWLTVVGIAPDIRQGELARLDVEPGVYVPFRPTRGAWVIAHTVLPPRSLAAALRQEVQRVDPELPVWLGPYPLDEWMAGTYWSLGVRGGLFALFAVLALSLACLGLFAVVAHSVAQRTSEIGVRLAIGATARDVSIMVLRQGLAPAAAGLVIGLGLSVPANRLLGSQLVGVAPWDPATLAVVAVVLLITTTLGCLVPARRATRVDPVVALRLE